MQSLTENLPSLIEQGLDGVVFYVDGGMRLVHGSPKASFGVHAFFYNHEPAKRGHGAKVFIPTPEGYVEKGLTKEEDRCTVLAYYDAFGPSSGGTNQTAEMDAFIFALKAILDLDLTKVLKRIRIYSDSIYVVDGTQKWLQGWKNRNWVTSSGKPVASQNRWLEIDKLWSQVKAIEGLDIAFTWVKGHVNFGNILADYQATTGLFSNRLDEDTIFQPKEYYEAVNGSSRLLLDSKMYHIYGHKRDQTDYFQYLTFRHPTSASFDIDKDVGKATRDFCIGVVRLKEPDGILEEVSNVCDSIIEKTSDVPVIVHLPNVFKVNNRDEVLKGIATNFNVTQFNHVKFIGNDTFLSILSPPRLAYRLRPLYSELMNVIDQYEEGDSGLVYTDITSALFETVVKKKKEELKFKFSSELSVKLPVNFIINDKLVEKSVTITFGINTPNKRTFSSITELNPKVGIITWEESESVQLFALLIETDEGVGLWKEAFGGSEYEYH